MDSFKAHPLLDSPSTHALYHLVCILNLLGVFTRLALLVVVTFAMPIEFARVGIIYCVALC